MATTVSFNQEQTYYDAYGTKYSKPIGEMSDQEFANYKATSEKNKIRQQQLTGTTTNSSAGSGSTGNTSLQQQAKDMAALQLENANKQMELSYGYRSKEKAQDDEIVRRQGEQQYGFQRGLADQNYNNQRGLADQNYSFQRGLNDQQNTQQTAMQNNQFNQERTMFNMQDAAQTRNTESARRAANSLYFGRMRGGNRGFQGRR